MMEWYDWTAACVAMFSFGFFFGTWTEAHYWAMHGEDDTAVYHRGALYYVVPANRDATTTPFPATPEQP